MILRDNGNNVPRVYNNPNNVPNSNIIRNNNNSRPRVPGIIIIIISLIII